MGSGRADGVVAELGSSGVTMTGTLGASLGSSSGVTMTGIEAEGAETDIEGAETDIEGAETEMDGGETDTDGTDGGETETEGSDGEDMAAEGMDLGGLDGDGDSETAMPGRGDDERAPESFIGSGGVGSSRRGVAAGGAGRSVATAERAETAGLWLGDAACSPWGFLASRLRKKGLRVLG